VLIDDEDDQLAEPRRLIDPARFAILPRVADRLGSSTPGRWLSAIRRGRRTRFAVPMLIVAVLVIAIAIDISANRSPAPPAAPDAISSLAPAVIQTCSAATSCLTTAGVPTVLTASARAAFPSAAVAQSASSFDAHLPLMNVAQLSLTEAGVSSIVLTVQRMNAQPNSAISSLQSSNSRRVLLSQQRGVWLLTVLITNAHGKVPADARTQAQSWLQNTGLPT
jgi:hypothetical protein